VQQGNVITQDMIDQLQPGMTRSQVSYVMGEPVFRNSFNANRWDYIYTIELPGIFNDERRVSLYFDDDRLAYFTGDYAPTSEKPAVEVDPDAEQNAAD
jgi:outer membrane protein assembly factor BamE